MFLKISKILLYKIVCISILIRHRFSSVPRTFECLYDECQCMNETSTTNNQISIICLAQNSTGIPSEQIDTNLQSLNIKTFQFYNYNLKALPYNLFANLTIEYLALDLKEVDLLEEKSFNSIKLLTHLAIYHLNRFENKFLSNHVANNLTSLSIELSDLASLDLIGKDISSCRNLNQLILSHNRLTDFVSSKILAEMKYIETLKLNNNQLENILFDIEMQSLKHLVLSSNKIRFIDDQTFKNVQNLVLLDLFENEIKAIEPHAFSHVKSLLYLYLGNNYLMKLPYVKCLVRLKQFDIKNQHGFLMGISNETFQFETRNKNQLNVYLDEHFLKQNLTYNWYFNANRPIQFEAFDFDLNLKHLEVLFRSYLRKDERFRSEPNDKSNKNYIIYRLLSQQTSSVFEINYFANNYQVDYEFQIENRMFSIRDQLDCLLTDFKGELAKKTRIFCTKRSNYNTSVWIKPQSSKNMSERNVSKNFKSKKQNLNFIPKSSARSLNLNLQNIFAIISIVKIFALT